MAFTYKLENEDGTRRPADHAKRPRRVVGARRHDSARSRQDTSCRRHSSGEEPDGDPVLVVEAA